MAIKLGGLLEKAMKKYESKICESCGNLVKVSETAFGCIAHDKLILPNYPPYHGNVNCMDWKAQKEGEKGNETRSFN